MHVPVLLTRQVFVNDVPAPILLLSGTVTSVTKEALFVQFGSLAGRGVSRVAVALGGVAGGSVTAGVSRVGVSGTAVSVWVGAWVSEAVGTAGCVAACGLQLESINVASNVIMNTLLTILNLL
jgi:hypothetical protein